jgi:hypothetical protein
MLRRLFSVGAVFILVAASVHGNLRAQSPSGEAGQGPEAGVKPVSGPKTEAASDAKFGEQVVSLDGQRVTLCGLLIQEQPSGEQGSSSPFPYVILARGQRFHLDPGPYKGLQAYLGRLPADLRPPVHVEGTREEKYGSPADGAPVIAVTLFQPLDHWEEMGVKPSDADKARAAAIAKAGGLVMTLPPEYPLFDAFRGALVRAGFGVIDKGKDGKDLGGRKNGFLFAELRPGATPDPRFITAMELDRRVRVYPFRNAKDINSAPPPAASTRVREIAAARGVAVVVPPGDQTAYDSISTGLTKAGFAVRESPVQREAGNIFATMRVQSPDLKYIETLARDPSLKVFPFKNYEVRIPAGEEGGPGERSSSTPPRRD